MMTIVSRKWVWAQRVCDSRSERKHIRVHMLHALCLVRRRKRHSCVVSLLVGRRVRFLCCLMLTDLLFRLLTPMRVRAAVTAAATAAFVDVSCAVVCV